MVFNFLHGFSDEEMETIDQIATSMGISRGEVIDSLTRTSYLIGLTDSMPIKWEDIEARIVQMNIERNKRNLWNRIVEMVRGWFAPRMW